MRGIAYGVLASAILILGAPTARAGTVLCHFAPGGCAVAGDPSQNGGGDSAPEPGTLGLLAIGAAASIGMLRRKIKKP